MHKVQSAISGVFWKTLEQYGVMGIQFILQIILARILDPEVYGIIAIVLVFTALSNVFIKAGFSTALIQKKIIDDIDTSSVLYFSLGIAAVLYTVLFFTSPVIANYFNMPDLRSLIRVMAICFFPGAICSIQNSLLSRFINFKAVFIASISAVFLSGSIGIALAYLGFGVWALAFQQLLYHFSLMFAQYFQIRWKPLFSFEYSRLKSFLSFGWKVLATNLVNEFFVEIRSIAIGRYYSGADLSFFNRGKQFPFLFMKSINGSLQAVLLPKMVQFQDDKVAQHSIMHRTISVSSYVMFPILAILALSASDMVSWMLTDKWLPCVVYIQLHCLYFATWPIETTNLQALYAVGRSDMVLKMESIRKVIDFILLVLTLKYGVVAIAIGSVVAGIVSVPFYIIPTDRIVGYNIRWQLRDMASPIILTLIMAVIVWYIGSINLPHFVSFCLQWVIGILVYISLSILICNSQLNYIKDIIVSLIRK